MNQSFIRYFLCVIGLAIAIQASAQTAIMGSVSPMVQKATSEAVLSDSTKLNDLRVYYTPTAVQVQALRQLVAEQRTPGSTSYHKWITPEQYGALFGVSSTDEARVISWLKSQGFTNVSLGKNRTSFAFNGTVANTQTAFHTSIRSMVVDGEKHYANISEVAIPENLADVIGAVRGLNDFKPKPMARKLAPQYTIGTNSYALVPADIATIYNIQKLYDAGVTGAGVTVAIVGESDINTADIAAYRAAWGLNSSLPTTVVVGTDPGHVSTYEIEADLDIELIGAVAREATIIYYAASNVQDAMEAAIEAGKAQVVSESYGGCETTVGAAFARVDEIYALEANAQGVTLVASSGDTGAAACDAATSASAKYGPVIYEPASIPEYTSVGGTSFTTTAGYFNNTNGADGGSAISYIPETSWNDTVSQSHLDASGGGASVYFTKPTWQDGTGVPSDGYRDVPDVAMFSSNADNGLGYLICGVGSCANGVANGGSWGGTSASAPVFAGIVALLNQYQLTQGNIKNLGLGNINPHLYLLAANTSDVFHDITTGSNIVPCTSGTTDCPSSGSYGYSAGPGYDQVTGLGSVDAYNLVTEWSNYSLTGSTTTVSASSTSPNYGNSVTLTATVKASSGSTTPDGEVVFFYTYQNSITAVNEVAEIATATLSHGVASITTASLPAGVNSVQAGFRGSLTFAESVSPVLSVTALRPTTIQMSGGYSSAVQYGTKQYFSFSVATSMLPAPDVTGTVTFYCNGSAVGTQALSSSNIFSITTLPVGTDVITAQYNGSSLFEASAVSSSVSVTITSGTPLSTTTTLATSATNITYGDSVTLTAAVAASGGTPTGTVTFYSGSTSLGSAILNNGTASLATTMLPVGSNSIKVVYAGDTGFNSSTSSTVSVTVTTVSTTTTLAASATSFTYGSSATLTATVAANSGSTTPTGTVTFYSGSTSLGSATLNSGTASLTTTALPVGTDPLKAVYAGSTIFSPSTSGTTSVSVTAPADFSIAVVTSNLTAKAGSTASTSIIVTDSNGFSGDSSLTFSCSGLPSGSSCAFGVPVITTTGSTVALSIATATTSAQTNDKPLATISAIYTALIPAVLFISFKRRKAFLSSLGLVSLLAAMVFGSGVVGCGGSASSTSGSSSSTTSTVTVKATSTSGMSHTTTIVLTVN